MARFYADENFSFPVVLELRRLGHDVLTFQESGLGSQGIPDPAVLAFGVSQGRAILTFNRRHFKRLHATHQPHLGIVVCTRDDDIAALALRIHATILATGPISNRLVQVNLPP